MTSTRHILSGIAALVGTAASVWAQAVDTEVRYETRVYDAGHDDGWGASTNARAGDRVEVRVLVSYVGTMQVAGLDRVYFQPVISQWQAGDHLLTNADLGTPGPADGIGPIGGTRSTPIGSVADLPGVYGRITPWGAQNLTTSTFLRGHTGTGTAAGLLRISQAHITNWIGVGPTSGAANTNNYSGTGGIIASQVNAPARLPTDPPFDDRHTGLIVFKFAFVVDPASSLGRKILIDTPPEGFARISVTGEPRAGNTWFGSVNESQASVRSYAFGTPGEVNIVPAPGAVCGVLGALSVLGSRLRCRHGDGVARREVG